MSQHCEHEKPFNCCNTCCTAVPPHLQFLLAFAIVSAAILVVCGILIAGPGFHAKTFQATTCTPVEITKRGDMNCSCSTGNRKRGNFRFCRSTFPCYDVYVKYSAGNQYVGGSKIAENYQDLWDPTRCSYHVRRCTSSARSNEEEVEEWLRTDGNPLVSYSCLYDPKDIYNIIRERRNRDSDIIASIAVPAVFLVVLLFLFSVGFYHHRTTPDCFYRWYVEVKHPEQRRAYYRNERTAGGACA